MMALRELLNNTSLKMDSSTMANGLLKQTIATAAASMSLGEDLFMKVSGKMIRPMVRAALSIAKVMFTKVSG